MQEFTYTTKKLGSAVAISVVTENTDKATYLTDRVLTIIDEFEQRFSRFIPNSELSLLNTNRKGMMSNEFMIVLQAALHLNSETGGVYNPLVQIKRFGYDKTFSELPKNSEAQITSYNTDIGSMIIDLANSTVTLAPPYSN